MNDIAEDTRAQRLDEVAQIVSTKVAPEQRATLQAFIARYYGQVDPEDLLERQPADLYGAALSHWNFARKRDAGHARVRVFNPTIEEHGWQSTHSVIEIVNDDMPFLVDSVAMELNRHGLTLHLIVHPILAVVRAADGTLTGLASDDAPAARYESFIHIEIDRTTDAKVLEALAADIARVLGDVRAAVDDWKKMADKDRASAAAAGRRDRGGGCVSGLVGPEPLHVSRLPLS
jgi:glutamate dehydrogenase